ncbi:hypothetical protein D6817_02290 [Candidatus Pacearchaeota archaeon]|nr:MAG: hypothetical protein D6817_02290 [Candidatus Pacearchaeota archaeon]
MKARQQKRREGRDSENALIFGDSVRKCKTLGVAKRAQEEMVGFMLVILLVAIIFLIFLGLASMRSKSNVRESAEVSQFLDALMELTTDCRITSFSGSVNPYKTVEELIRDYDRDLTCENGEKARDVLTRTIQEAIETSWVFSPESLYQGYTFEVDQTTGSGASSTQERIVELTWQGNAFSCTHAIGDTKSVFSASSTIKARLILCLSRSE